MQFKIMRIIFQINIKKGVNSQININKGFKTTLHQIACSAGG